MRLALTKLRRLEREFKARRALKIGSVTVLHWSNDAIPDDVILADGALVVCDFAIQSVSRRGRNHYVWVSCYERLALAADDHGMVFDGRGIALDRSRLAGLPILGQCSTDGLVTAEILSRLAISSASSA